MNLSTMVPLKLFATNEEVSDLEQHLATLAGREKQHASVSLAWYLRERDCTRAVAIADAVAAQQRSTVATNVERTLLDARILLVRATVGFLRAEFDEAHALAQASLEGFDKHADAVGLGDAHWLQTSIAMNVKGAINAEEHMRLAIGCYTGASDQDRLNATVARELSSRVFNG